MKRVIVAAVLFCFVALSTWADDVTYTNAELTEMASQKVKPNTTEVSSQLSGTGYNSTLDFCKGWAGDRVRQYYATAVLRDEAEFYEIAGYDPDRYFNVTCHPQATEVQDDDGRWVASTIWIDTRTAYEYALPKWIDETEDEEETQDEEESDSTEDPATEESTDTSKTDEGTSGSTTGGSNETTTTSGNGDETESGDSEGVTYTNSEIVAMSESYTQPNVVKLAETEDWHHMLTLCQNVANRHVSNMSVRVTVPNDDWTVPYQRMGYDADRMKIATCKWKNRGSSGWWLRLTETEFEYALPKWTQAGSQDGE